MSYFCKICNGMCFQTHIPVDYCFHEMKRIRWFRSETQCKKCLFQLPKGMTWVPMPKENVVLQKTVVEFDTKPDLTRIENYAFYAVGVQAERKRIIELMMNEPISEQVHKVIEMLKESESENGNT